MVGRLSFLTLLLLAPLAIAGCGFQAPQQRMSGSTSTTGGSSASAPASNSTGSGTSSGSTSGAESQTTGESGSTTGNPAGYPFPMISSIPTVAGDLSSISILISDEPRCFEGDPVGSHWLSFEVFGNDGGPVIPADTYSVAAGQVAGWYATRLANDWIATNGTVKFDSIRDAGHLDDFPFAGTLYDVRGQLDLDFAESDGGNAFEAAGTFETLCPDPSGDGG